MKDNELSESVAPEIEKEQLELKLRSLTIRRWLRTDELALYLGTTKMAIKHMKMRGKLRWKKYCGRIYYDRLALDRGIEGS